MFPSLAAQVEAAGKVALLGSTLSAVAQGT
jgi:hypothetical protein